MGIWPIGRDHMGRGSGMTWAPQFWHGWNWIPVPGMDEVDGCSRGGPESDTRGYWASKNLWCGSETGLGYDMDNRYPWVFFTVSNTREAHHGYCWQLLPVRSVRNLTGIADSKYPWDPWGSSRVLLTVKSRETRDVPHGYCAKWQSWSGYSQAEEGANRSVFVYYDTNETCAANWEKLKALILVRQFFLVNTYRAKHGFSLFLKLAGIALCALLRWIPRADMFNICVDSETAPQLKTLTVFATQYWPQAPFFLGHPLQ